MSDHRTPEFTELDTNGPAAACCHSVLLDSCCGPEVKPDCCGPQTAPAVCGCEAKRLAPERHRK